LRAAAETGRALSFGLILATILVPTAGFGVWLAGHYLRARRAERQAILRRGVRTEAEVVGSRGGRIEYRFEVSGWPRPITGHGRVPPAAAPPPGGRIAVRYLPGHPHISAIDDAGE
jgi:hypothetical protein